MSFVCPQCGKRYDDLIRADKTVEMQINVWGRICDCGYVIEAETPAFIAENIRKTEEIKKKALSAIFRR